MIHEVPPPSPPTTAHTFDHTAAMRPEGRRGNEASVVYFGNEFPNDDLKDLFRRLLQRSKDRRFRLLASFFQEATLVLKEEVAKLPRPARDEVPHFDTVLTLAEHGDFRDTSIAAAMEGVFLTVLQVGMLIG